MELLILAITKRMGGLIGVAGFVLIFSLLVWWMLKQSDKMIAEEFGEDAVKNSSAL